MVIGNNVKLAITTLYNSYKIKYYIQHTTSITSTSGIQGKNTRSAGNAIANFSRQNTSVSSCNKLFKYLDTDFSAFLTKIKKDNFDILIWLRDYTRNFSILFIMARDLLTPPASTVASETTFSAGNMQIEEMKNSLSPEILECQICIKD